MTHVVDIWAVMARYKMQAIMASMNNKDDDDGDDAAIPYRPLPPILIGSECYANNVKRQNDDKELIREQQGNNNIAHQ